MRDVNTTLEGICQVCVTKLTQSSTSLPSGNLQHSIDVTLAFRYIPDELGSTMRAYYVTFSERLSHYFFMYDDNSSTNFKLGDVRANFFW